MKLLDTIPEEAMVASWLQAEYASPRFSNLIVRAIDKGPVKEALILQPDLTNLPDNEQRKSLLKTARHDVLRDFPWDSMKWRGLEVQNREEVGELYTPFGATWLAFTNGERKLKLAAGFIASLSEYQDPLSQVLGVQTKVKAGEAMEPPILVTSSADLSRPLIIIEGNVRSVSFYLSEDMAYPIRYIVGISDTIATWHYCEQTLADIRQAFMDKEKE